MSTRIGQLPGPWQRGRLERCAAWLFVYALRSLVVAASVGVAALAPAVLHLRTVTIAFGFAAAGVFVMAVVLSAVATLLVYVGLILHRDNLAAMRRGSSWLALLSAVLGTRRFGRFRHEVGDGRDRRMGGTL